MQERLTDTDDLRNRIERITNLPTLPQVAARLIKTVNDPLASAGDVAFLVGQDISLSAKILRLANSAFYGMPRTITSIANAVVILGLRVINTMVLGLTVFDMFSQDKGNILFNRHAFWRHSLGCGLIAKMLTSRIKPAVFIEPEEAFCAGLLHDIGKVVMEQYLHDEFRTALAYAREKNLSIFDAEMQTLGATHTDVADWLTGGWELPPEIHAPLVYHHTPAAHAQCGDMIALCHIADYLCYQTDLVIDTQYAAPALDTSCMQKLGISSELVDGIKEAIPQEFDKMTLFINIASGK